MSELYNYSKILDCFRLLYHRKLNPPSEYTRQWMDGLSHEDMKEVARIYHNLVRNEVELHCVRRILLHHVLREIRLKFQKALSKYLRCFYHAEDCKSKHIHFS